MLLAAGGLGALLIIPRPLSGCQIKAEIKGFLLMYPLFLYYLWFFQNIERRWIPEMTSALCSIKQESQENISTLKTLINTKAADINDEMVNLHDQMEIGTNSKIDDLKANIELFVVEKVNASETLIETRIQDLETNLKGLIQDNTDNLVDMKQHIDYCNKNPCHNLATCVNLQDGFECNCVSGKVII